MRSTSCSSPIFAAIALAIWSGACSGGSLKSGGGTGGDGSGAAGTGGTAGSAGTTGTGGTGDAAGGSGGVGPATPLQLPDCLANLLAPCPTNGACIYAPTDAGTNWCLASGVKIAWSVVPDPQTCAGGGITVSQVSKPDGSACYSFESSLDGSSCEFWSYRWKDANGQVVATGYAPIPSHELTITCTSGGSAHCTGLSDACCGVGTAGGAACIDGVPNGVACIAGACP